jgi:hypothetical protein
MKKNNDIKRLSFLAGGLLIAAPMIFTGAFTYLQVVFEYPDILREPPAKVLNLFAAGGSPLLAAWYALLVAAVLFIPAVVLFHQVIHARAGVQPWLATISGVLAGLVQAMGFLRWVFVVPYLAQAYQTPDASAAARETIAVTFEVLNRYLGVGVGEHLGYLFTALWTILIAAALMQTRLLPRWFGAVGGLLGVGILAGVLEPFGVPIAGSVNALSYLLWAIWLVGLGLWVAHTRLTVKVQPGFAVAA